MIVMCQPLLVTIFMCLSSTDCNDFTDTTLQEEHIDHLHAEELSRIKDIFNDSESDQIDSDISARSPEDIKKNLFTPDAFQSGKVRGPLKEPMELDSEVSFNLDPKRCASTPTNESLLKLRKCDSCKFVTKSEKILLRHIRCKHPLPIEPKPEVSSNGDDDKPLPNSSDLSCMDCTTITNETDLMEHILTCHVQEKAEPEAGAVKNLDSLVDFYTKADPDCEEKVSANSSGRRGRPKKMPKNENAESSVSPPKKVERRGRPRKSQLSTADLPPAQAEEQPTAVDISKQQQVVEAQISSNVSGTSTISELSTSVNNDSTLEDNTVLAPPVLAKTSQESSNKMPSRAALLSALNLSPVEKDEDFEFEQAADKLEIDLAKRVNFLKKNEEKTKARRVLQRQTPAESGKGRRGSRDSTAAVSFNQTAESSINTTAESSINTTAESSFNTTAESSFNTTVESSFNATADTSCNSIETSDFTQDSSCITLGKSVDATTESSCNISSDDSLLSTAASIPEPSIVLNFVAQDDRVIATCNLDNPDRTETQKRKPNQKNAAKKVHQGQSKGNHFSDISSSYITSRGNSKFFLFLIKGIQFG